MESLPSWITMIATAFLALAAFWTLAKTLPDAREKHITQQRINALAGVFEYSWGLTDKRCHPLHAKENLRASRALNRAALLFSGTDAEVLITYYKKSHEAEDLKVALEKMADICAIELPFGFSDLRVFGPK